ncbi:MAG: deoxyribonuclease IV [Candidatus Dojkabacteria bacterium]|nr:MAG: deoxyribonuclease IV [Candidatus Dojkabacteria bacterium]
MERYLGAHVSASGGLKNAIANGLELEVNSIQTMFSAPMRWSTKDIDEKQIEEFAEAAANSNIKKILFHGVYLINLARAEKQMFHLSKLSLLTHLSASAKLAEGIKERGSECEVLGVTFHPGSAKDLTPEEGVKRISYGLNWILEQLKGGMILLESSAGSGQIMGDTLEELVAMREGVEDKARVGYVLDTQHMFVSGYDWRDNLDGIISQIESTIGLENVKAFHLNDSMKPFDSHKDRHANLGEGEIGSEAIKKLLSHSKLADKPFILETPNLKSMATARKEVAVLKSLAQ